MTLGTPAESDRLPEIGSFVCYYGQGETSELARYPLAIIEAKHYSPQQVKLIKQSGTVVVGYLSLGEILEEPAPDTARGSSPGDPALPPYYLDGDGDGVPDRSPGWGSLYVDARSPRWHQKVIDQLIPRILSEKGMDGLFLDTLDTVDRFPRTRLGMVDLVKEIRRRFPDIPLIANRGFGMIEDLGPLVDAFLFEAFSTRWDPRTHRSSRHSDADLAWIDSVVQRIRSLSGKGGPQILVLDYADEKDPSVKEFAITRARKAGLTFSISTGSLDRLPVDGGPQKPSRP